MEGAPKSIMSSLTPVKYKGLTNVRLYSSKKCMIPATTDTLPWVPP